MTYLTEILSKSAFDNASIDSINNYHSRDGFELIDTADYNGMTKFFSEIPVFQNLLPIMTDNNSNYICVYNSGILKGNVCHWDHEETSLEPKFRNIKNLITAIDNHPECWGFQELPERILDFPQNDQNYSNEDNKTISLLYALYNTATDDDLKTQTAFCIMTLTPPKNLATLYPFLDNEDMYIQERAIQTFGFHKYKPIKAKLLELQTTAKPNGQNAAKTALKKISENE